jgi:hypothetical protein
MENLKKISKVAYVCVRIIRIMGWIGFGAMLAAIASLAIFPSTGALLFKIGSTSVYSPVVLEEGETALSVIEDLSVSAPALLIACLMLNSILSILSRIKEDESPFTMANVTRIKQVALYMVLLTVVPYLVGMAASLATHIEPEGELHIDTWVYALVIYCLALAFEHGVVLQKQQDETL